MISVEEFIDKYNGNDGELPPINIKKIWENAKSPKLPNGEDFWQTKVNLKEEHSDGFPVDEYQKEEVDSWIDNYGEILEDFFKHTKTKAKDLYNSKLPNGQSTIKSLTKFQKTLEDHDNKYEISMLIDQLNELYRSNIQIDKINKMGLYLTITSDPIFFAKLSKYGCDSESCFGGSNSPFKYAARAVDNSVVIILTNKPYTKSQMVDANAIGRCFGILDKNTPAFTNFYQRGISREDFGAIILSVLRDNFNQKIKCIDCNDSEKVFGYDHFYSNHDSFVYSTKDIDRDYFRMDISMKDKNYVYVENVFSTYG